MRPPNKKIKSEDTWFGIYWKPAAAIIYLAICIFDFIIAPVYLNMKGDSLSSLILAIRDLSPDAQVIVLNLKLAAWEPLTLKGSGVFHMAFGAILGATVWARGQERVNEIRQGWNPYNSQPYDSGYADEEPEEQQPQPTRQKKTAAVVDNPDE